MLLDDLLRRRRVHVPVDDGRHSRDDDFDRRLGVAEAHAPRLADQHVGEALLVQRLDERREGVLRAGGDAASAHADYDLDVLVRRVAHVERLLLLLAHLAQVCKRKLSHLNCPSF